MIIANQQIAIHLKNIRNLTGYNSGRFFLRISIRQTDPKKQNYATPVNIIQKQTSKTQNRSQFDEQFYVTRAFPLKSGTNVDLNQICIFKISSSLYNFTEEEYSLILKCQIVQIQLNKHRVVGVFTGKLTGFSIHEYLQMDFYDIAACQVVGSIHSCLYKFQFKDKQNVMDIKTFCQKYCNYKDIEVMEYIENQIKRSYKIILENYKLITHKEKELKINTVSKQNYKSAKILAPLQQKDVAERQTEFGDDQVAFQVFPEKKKRRRIFSTSAKNYQNQKYIGFQKLMHENAQNIYQLWREITSSILKQEGEVFIATNVVDYRKNLKEKVGESIVRFKGSWDVDTYGDQQNLRAKMAYQLRNQDKEFDKDFKTPQNNLLSVVNQQFFSSNRPIFFQQKAIHFDNQLYQVQSPIIPDQILIIMVHGLGACRLDMQKIKVQIRRYYDSRFKMYISSTNEGRTEGDIDTLGMRLAAEIDHQLTKYQTIPKICLLGHSMGGLIIRSALPRLQKYKQYFHSLITLSSPHLGYAYSTSKLVDAGLWLVNQMKKCTSILQMTMQDTQVPEESFLYKLSQKPGLQWFKKIVFLASHQDLYVPFYSARIQKHQQSTLDNRKLVKKGVIYCDMIDNILSRFKGEIIRLDVNFCIPQQNLDNLIGRAAHISFITNVEMVRTFILAGNHYFI